MQLLELVRLEAERFADVSNGSEPDVRRDLHVTSFLVCAGPAIRRCTEQRAGKPQMKPVRHGCAGLGTTAILSRTKGDAVHWMDGSDWFWMSSMMLLWIALIGVVVYVAVRAARRSDPKL